MALVGIYITEEEIDIELKLYRELRIELYIIVDAELYIENFI